MDPASEISELVKETEALQTRIQVLQQDTTASTHTSSLSSVFEEADPAFQQKDSETRAAGHGAMLEGEGLGKDGALRHGNEHVDMLGGQQTDEQPISSETTPIYHAHQSHAAQTGAHLDPDASPHRHPANISSHLTPRFDFQGSRLKVTASTDPPTDAATCSQGATSSADAQERDALLSAYPQSSDDAFSNSVYLECAYDGLSWTLSRTVEELRALHSDLYKIPGVSQLPPFPLSAPLSPALRGTVPLSILEALSVFIVSAACDPSIQSTDVILGFLELSAASLSSPRGTKWIEGPLSSATSAPLVGAALSKSWLCNMCPPLAPGKALRWWALRDGELVSMPGPRSTGISSVHIFGPHTRVSNGSGPLSISVSGLLGGPSPSTLLLRAPSKASHSRWLSSLRHAVDSSAFSRPKGNPHASFAPPRAGCASRWFSSGCAYFSAVADAIEGARDSILIAAWFLSPEVELKRDGGAAPKGGGSWRLEELLRKAAERGVKVYVMVYGEVPFTLPNGSGHAAKRIREFVPNATVIRCPRRHWGNRGGILFWAHHEKIVCIDGGRGGAFVGGMDLSFGRWDFSSHPVGDVQVDGLSWWPGKDYSNEETHVTAPVTDPHTDHMDRRSEPRLPWHDFACQVSGDAACDVARHFITRWNFHRSIERHSSPLLAPPCPFQHGHTSQLASSASAPSQREMLQPKAVEPDGHVTREGAGAAAAKDGGKGKEKKEKEKEKEREYEDGEEDQRLSLNQSNDSAQFDQKDGGSSRVPVSGASFGEATAASLVQGPGGRDNHEMVSRVRQSVELDTGAWTGCSVQLIRSLDQWSGGCHGEASIQEAYIHLILNAEHSVHIEQQFFVTDTAGGGVKNGIGSAIVKRIKRAVSEGQKDFRVIIILPLSPAMGSSPEADPVCRKLVGFTYKSICRGKSSIMSQIRQVTDDADRYIGFYGLRQYGLLDSGKCATSQVYVHGKLIIVDDRHVICGSANINDRSMLSHSDSELAVLTSPSPGDEVATTMYSKPWTASRFAHTLRTRLWQRHLGLDSVGPASDPGSHDALSLWSSVATANTQAYRECFRCVPDDSVKTFASSAAWEQGGSSKRQSPEETMRMMQGRVKGVLVEFPLMYLEAENLSPKWSEPAGCAVPMQLVT